MPPSTTSAAVSCAICDRHIGLSGIVVRAVAAKGPVLACNCSWIGRATERFKLGITGNVHDHPAFTKAIGDACRTLPDVRFADAAAKFSRFHTEQNFLARLLHDLRQQLKLFPLPSCDWRDVRLEHRGEAGSAVSLQRSLCRGWNGLSCARTMPTRTAS